MAISDENCVKLEGIVHRSNDVMEIDEKKVINFTIENSHVSNGRIDRQIYNCVAWNKAAEKYGPRLEEGVFVRITGHLQSNSETRPDGTILRYNKVCADHILFSEEV